jgi:hypothetical protein
MAASSLDQVDAVPQVGGGWLDARVDEILNRRAAVGLVVGVVRPETPAVFCTRGLADIGSRTPVTEDTVFRIGSITKTFTAIAVMGWSTSTLRRTTTCARSSSSPAILDGGPPRSGTC